MEIAECVGSAGINLILTKLNKIIAEMGIIRFYKSNKGAVIPIKDSEFELDGTKFKVGKCKEGLSIITDNVEMVLYRHFEKSNWEVAKNMFIENYEKIGMTREKVYKFIQLVQAEANTRENYTKYKIKPNK